MYKARQQKNDILYKFFSSEVGGVEKPRGVGIKKFLLSVTFSLDGICTMCQYLKHETS